MSARRLLVLCYFYPPLGGGGVHRVLGYTRHLPHHGWACTVVCAGPEDYWVTDETLAHQVPDDTEVLRVSGGSAMSAWLRVRGGDRGRRSGRLFGGLRRLSDWWLFPDSYAGWAARARAVAERRIAAGGIDAVLSSSPPDSVHLAALGLMRRHPLPWVADFRDPWMGLHFRRPPTAWHRARHAALERRVLERSDLTLVASRAHADRIAASGTRARRVLHLPNGFEPEPSGSVPAEAPSPWPTFTLAFTGTLSLMPDTEVFLDALHEVLARHPEARRRLRARLAGPFDSGYADRAVALGLSGIVEFMGPRAHAETRALQRRADVLMLWKPRATPTMVPGKLYEYLDSGRPVLALIDAADEAAELVRRGGGTVIAPGDRAVLAREIERRYVTWRDGAAAPLPARPAWLETHTRAHLAGQLAAALDGLMDPARAPA